MKMTSATNIFHMSRDISLLRRAVVLGIVQLATYTDEKVNHLKPSGNFTYHQV
jgi:hypothetical protein